MEDLLFLGVLVDSILAGYAIGAALTYYFPLGFRKRRPTTVSYTIRPISGAVAYGVHSR